MAEISNVKMSIITATFNSERYLEETIRSVISQSYSNIEYIIIDGGSTDRTLRLVEKYADKIDKVISEADKGIYDAFNKGISIATGDVIYFLNSDDYLIQDNIIKEIAKTFSSHPQIDVIYGNVLTKDEKNGYEYVSGKLTTIEDLKEGRMCPHQGFFVRKKLFDKYGQFNLDYKIASDFDFAIKCFTNNIEASTYIDQVIAVFRTGGESSSPVARQRLIEEQSKIIYKHFGIKFADEAVNIDVNSLYKTWLDVLLLQKKGITDVLRDYGVKNVAIFGTMKTAYYLYEDLRKEQFNIVCFLDNNKNMYDRTIHNINICSPSILLKNPNTVDAVILSIESHRDIEVKKKLKELFKEQDIQILSWKELVRMSSEE